jgi:hypothetical protein
MTCYRVSSASCGDFDMKGVNWDLTANMFPRVLPFSRVKKFSSQRETMDSAPPRPPFLYGMLG